VGAEDTIIMFTALLELRRSVADYTVGTLIVMVHLVVAGRAERAARVP
jgi:hypothetical protein